MPKTLTLQRKGKFKIETDGNNHCGLDHRQVMKYWVTVVCKAQPSLDERGFLFEQRSVDTYFQDLAADGVFTESCELLAINYAKEIRNLILEENPECKILAIEVKISAKPYLASMTFNWVKPR